MKLALVGWAADSGVGRECIDALRHLPVSAAFILPNDSKPTRHDLLPSNIHVHLATNGDPEAQMEAFLARTKVDTVLTWEVPGFWGFPGIWARRKVRWVHVVHWDWFDKSKAEIWKQAALIAPNMMCQNLLKNYGLPSVLLSVPIDTDRLVFKERKKANLFVSVYGYGGSHDRRSLPELAAAWGAMKNPPSLTIKAQVKPPELRNLVLSRGIDLWVGNTPEPSDLYDNADVAVQPSRYEGLGLSMLEAQARGVPVITTDAAPMNEIVLEPRISVQRMAMVEVFGKHLESFVPSSEALRRIVEGMAGKEIHGQSRRARHLVESKFSWRVLMPRWLSILRGKPPGI